jgi:hypothetical protein
VALGGLEREHRGGSLAGCRGRRDSGAWGAEVRGRRQSRALVGGRGGGDVYSIIQTEH